MEKQKFLILTLTTVAVIAMAQPFLFAGTTRIPEMTVTKLASDFRFTEGPGSDGQGNIYFTDIQSNRIHKWSADGKLSTFLENTGAANGLYFDTKGNLIACAGGTGKLISIDKDGKVTTLVDGYEGKPFNSPNDLWIDAKGGIYFTDPRYGSRENLPQDGEHVYYVTPDRTKVIRVLDDMVRPNGVIGTPDGKRLYVADHAANKTYRCSINPDGTLSDKTLFVASGSDGMTLDTAGNLYLTVRGGVMVCDPTGKEIGRIRIPEQTTNVCFGGPDGKTLFITAGRSLYSAVPAAKFYRFAVNDIDGKPVRLSDYAGKVLLVVNVASKCGYTPQYKGLQTLYEKYKDRGFEVLGFPANNFGSQEPGTNAEIKEFCTSKFDVTFPMFSKISVKGDDIHPLYAYLTSTEENGQFGGPIKWNFNKFLIGKDGTAVARFDSGITPQDTKLTQAIESELAD